MAENTADPFVKYIGGGRFFNGVPARDLAFDEWMNLPEEIRAAGFEQGVYAPVPAVPAFKMEPEEGEE